MAVTETPEPVTIFTARQIVTMNPSNPLATHVAVRDGRVLGVGSLDDLTPWGPYVLDHTFDDHVLVPGFVEAHTHVLEGGFWRPGLHYVGLHPRTGPDGQVRGGIANIDELIEHLRALDADIADPDEHLVCWGLDPLYFEGDRLDAEHLDAVSTTRPILVIHASFHLATVNTAMMRISGIDEETETEGVLRGRDGQPNGELQEMSAMVLSPAMRSVLASFADEDCYWLFGRLAANAGVTTATDLGSGALVNADSVRNADRATSHPDFPMRLVLYPVPGRTIAASDPETIAERFLELATGTTDKLRFGGIKIIGDGSIQGYTAVLGWPGYINASPNGLWQVDPDALTDIVTAFHRAGINVHIHANGDETTEAAIDAVDQALRGHAWLDHRHTIQHCQLTTSAQYRRMAKLGMCANIFSNHMWHWGDQHYESTVGPDRANGMDACGTAKREGVRFAIHSDAPITPIGPLHVMWCAVNRLTPKGRVLGPLERISALDALAAVTIDAAYQLHLDHEVGSIEVGKWADFAVLDASPLDVDPMEIRNIGVWGTVLAGRPFPAGTSAPS